MAGQLDVKAEINKIRQMYEDGATTKYVNWLVIGNMGTGKTYSLQTLPRPLLVHSFDPGGSKVLRDGVKDGSIIVEQFEEDSAAKPQAFKRWESRLLQHLASGFFNHFASYAIDSATTLQECLLHQVINQMGGGKNPHRPELQHYQVMISTMKDIVKTVTTLDLHTVLIGHVDMDKDEVTGRMVANIAATGKLRRGLPILYDEVYIAEVLNKPKGPEYSWITQPRGNYHARSRLANIDASEEQNFKRLMEKSGDYPATSQDDVEKLKAFHVATPNVEQTTLKLTAG